MSKAGSALHPAQCATSFGAEEKNQGYRSTSLSNANAWSEVMSTRQVMTDGGAWVNVVMTRLGRTH